MSDRGKCPVGGSVRSGKCPVGEVSGQGNVRSGKCPVGEVSCRWSVRSVKCPVGEVSGRGSVRSGKCLVGEVSGRGRVHRGCVRDSFKQGHLYRLYILWDSNASLWYIYPMWKPPLCNEKNKLPRRKVVLSSPRKITLSAILHPISLYFLTIVFLYFLTTSDTSLELTPLMYVHVIEIVINRTWILHVVL